MTDLPRLRLKAQEERRLREGHAWVYSNEVDIAATPLKAFAPGDQAVVEDSRGKPLGVAIVNPNTLICARLVGRDVAHPLSASLFTHRLQYALDHVLSMAAELGQLAIDALPVRGPAHAPAQQRI